MPPLVTCAIIIPSSGRLHLHDFQVVTMGRAATSTTRPLPLPDHRYTKNQA